MDIQHIRYFLAIAKYGSFSKAAEKLYVTQPILTRCVKNLETELGVPLILRSTRSFSLTDAGRILAEGGADLLVQHQDLYRRIQDVTTAQTGDVQISCPGILLDMYFPQLVTQYHKEHPGIRISIRESGTRSVVQDVLDGTADIGLVMLPLEGEENLNVFPIVEDEVHVLVHKDHPLASHPTVHIRDLKDQDIITYNESTTLYHAFLELCRQHGFSPMIAFQSMMPGFILDTLAYGSCVGVLPAPMLRRLKRQDLVSIPLKPHFPWQIAMVTKKDRYLSHAAGSFLGFSQSFLSGLSQQK